MMSYALPSWEAFYCFITSVREVLFLVVDYYFILFFSLLLFEIEQGTAVLQAIC